MAKPIPDEVLRRCLPAEGAPYVDYGIADDAGKTVTSHDVVRELLALRQAVRDMLERYCGLVNCGDCGYWDPETEDEVRALRALLPEEPS